MVKEEEQWKWSRESSRKMHECNANRSSLLQSTSFALRPIGHRCPSRVHERSSSPHRETEVVEHGLDVGQVRELDRGRLLCYAVGFGGSETGFFMRRPDLSSAGADYEEEEANFVLQRRTITKRSRHPIGPYGPISTYFTKI
jgi:hypothetical protein